MGLLDNLERGLERAVRSAFSAGGSHAVKPVEIASALRHTMDDESITVSEGHVVAPNNFVVRFSEPDFARAREWGTALAQELCDEVIRYADSQQYSLPGTVRVAFHADPDLREGNLEVDSRLDDGAAASDDRLAQDSPSPSGAAPGAAAVEEPPQRLVEHEEPAGRAPRHRDEDPGRPVAPRRGDRPRIPAARRFDSREPRFDGTHAADVQDREHRRTPTGHGPSTSRPGSAPASGPAVPSLEVDGRLHPLAQEDVVVGRSHERADLVLTDSSVSREHVRLIRTGRNVTLIDLGSRNGVTVNGRRVDGSATLHDSDRITVGQTTLVFHAAEGQEGR